MEKTFHKHTTTPKIWETFGVSVETFKVMNGVPIIRSRSLVVNHETKGGEYAVIMFITLCMRLSKVGLWLSIASLQFFDSYSSHEIC